MSIPSSCHPVDCCCRPFMRETQLLEILQHETPHNTHIFQEVSQHADMHQLSQLLSAPLSSSQLVISICVDSDKRHPSLSDEQRYPTSQTEHREASLSLQKKIKTSYLCPITLVLPEESKSNSCFPSSLQFYRQHDTIDIANSGQTLHLNLPSARAASHQQDCGLLSPRFSSSKP